MSLLKGLLISVWMYLVNVLAEGTADVSTEIFNVLAEGTAYSSTHCSISPTHVFCRHALLPVINSSIILLHFIEIV